MTTATQTPRLEENRERGSHSLQRLVGRHSWALLINADCRDVTEQLQADAIVTDPPYGIAYDAGRYNGAIHDGVMEGDTAAYDPTPMLALKMTTVLWGGNNYADRLPAGGWICWDKRCCEAADKALGSPFELAWCSDKQTYKMIRMQHGGWINKDEPNERRLHPTQKPVALMARCIEMAKVPEGGTVCDPYMGSGSTGVACVRLHRNFIGVEKDKRHFDNACDRIRRELEGALL